jgi:glutaredoxin
MNFTVYSKEGCPYCEKILAIFDAHEFNTVEYKLNKDFTAEQFYDEFGEGSTFPQVVLNDITLGGCVDTIRYLQDNDICCKI